MNSSANYSSTIEALLQHQLTLGCRFFELNGLLELLGSLFEAVKVFFLAVSKPKIKTIIIGPKTLC